jgi:hypothetical protein
LEAVECLPDMSAAAQAGTPGEWFDDLPTDAMNALVQAALEHPEIVRLADASRPEWLPVLFACADAGRRGATEARALALAWSMSSKLFRSKDDFNRDWRSFRPRPGGITVGTLLAAAAKAGMDLSRWQSVGRAIPTVVKAVDDATAGGGPAAGQGAAAFPIARGAPFTLMPHKMSEAVALEHFNARLCKVTNWGGAPSFGLFDPGGSLVPVRPTDLSVLLSGHVIETPDGKGGAKLVPAAVWWPQNPRKPVYDRLCYDPERKRVRPGECVLNTWRGFAVQPAKGSWRKMRWGRVPGGGVGAVGKSPAGATAESLAPACYLPTAVATAAVLGRVGLHSQL